MKASFTINEVSYSSSDKLVTTYELKCHLSSLNSGSFNFMHVNH